MLKLKGVLKDENLVDFTSIIAPGREFRKIEVEHDSGISSSFNIYESNKLDSVGVIYNDKNGYEIVIEKDGDSRMVRVYYKNRNICELSFDNNGNKNRII